MKIITDNAVYIQKNDMVYLNQSNVPIPASIFLKVFGGGIVIISDENRFDFLKFDGPEEISFFKSVDWVINYDDVKDLSNKDIIRLASTILDERQAIATTFNAMTKDAKRENRDSIDRCNQLEYMVDSLAEFYWYRKGKILMDFSEVFEDKKTIEDLEVSVQPDEPVNPATTTGAPFTRKLRFPWSRK